MPPLYSEVSAESAASPSQPSHRVKWQRPQRSAPPSGTSGPVQSGQGGNPGGNPVDSLRESRQTVAGVIPLILFPPNLGLYSV